MKDADTQNNNLQHVLADVARTFHRNRWSAKCDGSKRQQQVVVILRRDVLCLCLCYLADCAILVLFVEEELRRLLPL